MKLTHPVSLPQPKNRADLAAEREARCRADVLRAALGIADDCQDGPRLSDRKVPRAELLRRLPHWTHSAIHKALRRLEAEGLVRSIDWLQAVTKVWAFLLTPEGERTARGLTTDQATLLAEVMVRLRLRPERLEAALDAICNDGTATGDC